MNTPDFYFQHPGEIPLNFTLPSSDEVYFLTFNIINEQAIYSLRYVVIHSCAITLSLVLFLLLLLFIKQKKTPVFILNQIILLMVILRSSLYLAYQFGPLSSLTSIFTGIVKQEDFGKYKVSVAANAALIILIFLIQTSFTYQIFIIFKSPEMQIIRYMITSFSVVFQLVTFGFYVNTAVILTRQYQSMFDSKPFIYGSWETNLPSILFCVSVAIMSLVLVSKLVCAIRTRKYLGLKQFLSYHILLIMFVQSMFIPAVLTIVLHAFPERNGILNDVSVTLTAAFLPFTTLWSCLANNTRKLTSSSLILTGSDSNLCNSPSVGKYSDNFTDDSSIHGDDYAFFPQKLQKLSSESATSQMTGSTIKPSGLSQQDALDNLSERLIPNDILQILKEGDDGMFNKHISTVSVESIDIAPEKIECLKVFNQLT